MNHSVKDGPVEKKAEEAEKSGDLKGKDGCCSFWEAGQRNQKQPPQILGKYKEGRQIEKTQRVRLTFY